MLTLDTSTAVGDIPRHCVDVLRERVNVEVLEETNDVGHRVI